MILHHARSRPHSWTDRRARIRHRWLLPLVAIDLAWEWLAYLLSNWSFLEVLEYLGSFSVLIGVIFWFSESGERIQQRHYQAWQVINTAQGKGGSGGRIEALQELNADRIPLTGVDVSSAFLQGLHLAHANLMRSNFSSADLRNSDLRFADLPGPTSTTRISATPPRARALRPRRPARLRFHRRRPRRTTSLAPTSPTPISAPPICAASTGSTSPPSSTPISPASGTRPTASSPGLSRMAPSRLPLVRSARCLQAGHCQNSSRLSPPGRWIEVWPEQPRREQREKNEHR